jgi:7-carboxy-7-deazaguanine synthase
LDNLRIAEIFTSIQGEGILVGTPSTFIRVSGCNLRCGWCDTPYASWDPEGPIMSMAEIVAAVKTRNVVLTGGEPMIFDAIEPLCKHLRLDRHHITIETAGTAYRDVECDLMSISPKLSNSTPAASTGKSEMHAKSRINMHALSSLINKYNCQLKFVVTGQQDVREIDELLERLPSLPSERILLMAEGTDSAVIHERERNLVNICLERGWRLTPRFHIDIFGNGRGT